MYHHLQSLCQVRAPPSNFQEMTLAILQLDKSKVQKSSLTLPPHSVPTSNHLGTLHESPQSPVNLFTSPHLYCCLVEAITISHLGFCNWSELFPHHLLCCSTPGLPVHHQPPEFTQTHVHRVGDAIQPSHPLSSPSPPAPNPSQHQSLFQ